MSEMIPEGWQIKKLDDCCEILDSKRIPLNSEERASRKGRYPYYGANGIQDYIDDFIFDGDSILLAEDGGNFDQYEHRPIAQWVTGRFWVNNHAHILRAKKNNLDKWIFYSLVHKNILKFINVGTRAKLNQATLKEIEVSSPPPPEQKKIASILTSVDEVIENTQKQINKLQDLKKATMNELLTKGIGHTEFKDSELGRIPEEWESRELQGIAKDYKGSIVDGPFGSNLKTSDYTSAGVPVLQGKNVTNDKFVWSDVRFISQAKANELLRSSVRVGDILMVKIGSVGYSAIVNDLRGFNYAIIPANLLKIDINEKKATTKFIHYYLTSPEGKRRIVDEATSTAQPALSLGTVKKFKVPLPTLPEQKKIVSILSPIDKNIEEKQYKLHKIQSLKKSLMQDLLTGKVRVKVN